MRKGFATVPMVLIVLSAIMSVSVLGVGTEAVLGIEGIIAEEALPMISNRVSYAIYMSDSMDEADITMNFRTDFSLEESDDGLMLVFRDRKEPLDPGVDFDYDESALGEEFGKLCISKENHGNPKISPGECS